jgi:hypothetical protein
MVKMVHHLVRKITQYFVWLSRRELQEDLADEIEAIRLAADISSRRIMADQLRDGGGGSASSGGGGGAASSSSRLRIRALLDKQKYQRVRRENYRSTKKATLFLFLI